MARRLRKRSEETPAEELWRDACGSVVGWRLLERCAAIPTEARLLDAMPLRTPAEALWRCLRTRSGAKTA